MTLAEELAVKHGFGTQHPAFRAAVDEALERMAQACYEEAGDDTRDDEEFTAGWREGCRNVAKRIREMKSESPDGQSEGPR